MSTCTYCELDKSDPRIEIGHPKFDADLRLLWIVSKMYHERKKIAWGKCQIKSKPNEISTYFD